MVEGSYRSGAETAEEETAEEETAGHRCRRWSAAAADGWLAAGGGALVWRLVGCRLRLPAFWLAATANGRLPPAVSLRSTR
jgi:hypothetical protein